MADYHPLISRAVEGLGNSTGEARRALYERARTALVAQLRAVEPALSESDITRERLALEEAIRKVEAEAARKSRGEQRAEPRLGVPPLRSSSAETRTQIPSASSLLRRDRPISPSSGETHLPGESPAVPDADEIRTNEAPRPAAPASARNRLLSARTSPISREGLRGFRNVVSEVDDLGAATAKAAQSARDTRDSYETASPQQPFEEDEPPSQHDLIEPNFETDEFQPFNDESPQLRSLEPSFEAPDEEPMLPPRLRRPRQARRRVGHFRRSRRDGVLAMVQHFGVIPVLRPYAVAADPDKSGAHGRA
jgi:hypothetical protein